MCQCDVRELFWERGVISFYIRFVEVAWGGGYLSHCAYPVHPGLCVGYGIGEDIFRQSRIAPGNGTKVRLQNSAPSFN